MQHDLTGADGLVGCFVGSATKELPLPKRVFSESLKWDFLGPYTRVFVVRIFWVEPLWSMRISVPPPDDVGQVLVRP